MSFIQSICGPATSNEFVFSTSNVSSDNASFINLSVLGDATIVTLSTTNFSPTTLDAQVLTAVNGTIATFQSTSSYISNLSVSSMSVDNLSVGEVDITLLDVETIEADRIKIMDTVNSNYSQLVRASDIFTIAGGYIDPLDPSVVYEGQINITSGAGAARAINISLNKANISGNVIDSDIINVSTLNVSDVNAVSVVTVDIDADEGNFGVVNTPFLNVSTLGVSDIVTENVSVINASVNNLSVYNTLDIKDRDGSNHHGSIYNDTSGLHIAGNGEVIRIRSGGAFDEIVVTKTSGRVNISNLNVSQMTGIDVTLTGTMDSTTVIANDINTPLLNVSNISVDEDISCEQIVCADVICNDVTTNFLFDVDLTNNLSAGQGITISSINDVAVISATTSISDPFNISKLNVSNISVDVNVSVTGSLTCDGNISVGLQYTQEIIFMNAAMTTQNSQIISANTQDTYNLLTQNYSIQGSPGIKYLFCDNSLGNTNISNLSCDTVSVAGSFTCNDAQIDDLFNCDMTNTLRGGTSGLDIPFDNMSVEFATGTLDTLVMMKPNIVLYSVSLLPNLLTLAPPTFEMTTGTAQIANANMCNLSVNNLSVLTDITTPAATITDLTIPASGTFDHDFSKNFTAGTGISITHVGDQVTIAATGGSVTDPLNLSKLNVSNISCDEGITTDNISVNNLSVLESITVGTSGVGGGIYARNGTGIFSTGGFYFNNSVDGTGGNFNIFWIGGNVSSYGIGTLDGHDVRIANGYNTGGLVVDGTINNINMSNCSINNLSVDVVISGLTNASTINTEFLNVSGSAPFFSDGLTVFGSTTTQNISTNHISSGGFITAVGDIRAGGGFRAIGGSGIISTGAIQFNNQTDGLGDSLEIYYTGTQFGMGTTSGKDFTINAGYSTGGLVVDGTLNNINMSNCSITNLSLDTLTTDLTSNLTAGTNITITSVGGKPVISASGGGSLPSNVSFDNVSISNKLTVVDSIGCQTVGADGNIQSSNSFTLRSDAFTALTQTINGSEFRISTTNNNQNIRICNATGAGGLLFDAGLNNISIDNLSVANLSVDNISTTTFSTTEIRLKDPADPTVTKGVIFCNPVAFQYYGPSQVFFNNTVSPNVEYMRMDSTLSNVNISNLSATNTSILNDATVTNDLTVDRYLDRGKPRFIMLYRTSGLALTGAQQPAVFNANTTAQLGGEFGIANGSDIQVSTGGWYRVSFALGFLRTSGTRLTVRPNTTTRTNTGSFNYEASKDIYGASCYMRSSTLNREGYTTGTVLRYIPANGWVRINLAAIVETNGNFTSDFTGTNLRNQSNFMVEFVSSAAET